MEVVSAVQDFGLPVPAGRAVVMFDFMKPVLTKKSNIVMFKTHKTASTSLGSILFRFGARHGRRFLIGDEHYTQLRDADTFRLGGHMHINHHVLETLTPDQIGAFYSRFIPNPTFISIVRHPRERYLSAYKYFWEPFYGNKFNIFLGDQRYINQQSRDFGIHNATVMNNFLAPGGFLSKMGPVLITERFDESLVLMKRAFGWEMHDLLYIRLLDSCNSLRNHAGKLVKCDPPSEAQLPAYSARIDQNNDLDTILYDVMVKRHEDEVRKQDSSFAEEVELLKRLREKLSDYCRSEAILFNANREQFMQSITFCTQYVLDDLVYGDIIRRGGGTVQWILPGGPVQLD